MLRLIDSDVIQEIQSQFSSSSQVLYFISHP